MVRLGLVVIIGLWLMLFVFFFRRLIILRNLRLH